MGNHPAQLLQALNDNGDYQALFAQAFPDQAQERTISLDQIYLALAAFQASLISLNSRYDRYCARLP